MPAVFTSRQRSIILGSLLGDGGLSKPRSAGSNSYFFKPQKATRRDYLQWHLDELQPFSSSLSEHWNSCKGKWYRRADFLTHVNPVFTRLRHKWYPEGKKIVPRDIKLDPLSIAVWFFDDGSNNLKARACKFATYCFSSNDCNFLIDQLLRFNIRCHLGNRNVIYTYSESYKSLVDLVRPYMLWPCFEHKIRYRDSELHYTTESEAHQMFDLYESGHTQKQIAAEIGKSLSVVSSVLRGVRAKPVGRTKIQGDLSLKNTSGHRNVYWDKPRQKWKVSFKLKEGTVNLGRFQTKEEAIKVAEEYRSRMAA